MIRRWGAILGLWRCVWTEDFNGVVRLRILRSSPFGGYYAYGVIKETRGRLMPDGSIWGGCYMERWMPWPYNARPLPKELSCE
jgi:hypothetical protein